MGDDGGTDWDAGRLFSILENNDVAGATGVLVGGVNIDVAIGIVDECFGGGGGIGAHLFTTLCGAISPFWDDTLLGEEWVEDSGDVIGFEFFIRRLLTR